MTPAYAATQAGLAVAALVAVLWAIRENRYENHRIALSHGMSPKAVVAGLLVMALSIAPLYAIMASRVIPLASPLAFGAVVGCYAIAVVAAMLAAIVRTNRSSAIGWLTVKGDGSLHVEAPDLDESITLEPNSVRVLQVAGKPLYLQFRLPLEDGTLLLLAMVGARDLTLAEPDSAVEPAGLLLASGNRFLDAVRPYIVQSDRR